MKSICYRFLLLVLIIGFLISPAVISEEAGSQAGKGFEIISLVDESTPGTREISGALKELVGRVEQLRELKFTAPLKWGIKNREELKKLLLEELAKDCSDEELKGTMKTLTKLGAWPADKDLKEEVVKVLSQEVAAFYHPPTKCFYFVGSYGGLYLRIVGAHELTHVLQDQHFDLESLPLQDKDNSDRALAVEALLEGDANAVMLDLWLAGDSSRNQCAQSTLTRYMSISGGILLREVPAYLRENLLFPYIWGLVFVQEARRQGGWDRVNKVFADLPDSTEQILHPAKYFQQRDKPVRIKVPDSDLLPAGWRQIENDVVGELNLYVVLLGFLTMDQARSAAQGWDGDRLVAFENESGDVAVAIFTTWDSDKDAQEFFYAYKKVIERKYRKEKLLEGSSSLACRWATGEEVAYLERKGSDVLVIEGLPPGLTQRVEKRLWQTKKIFDVEGAKPDP